MGEHIRDAYLDVMSEHRMDAAKSGISFGIGQGPSITRISSSDMAGMIEGHVKDFIKQAVVQIVQ